MRFTPAEIPVAISMIQLAEMTRHPFQRYLSFWAAFNNIYTQISQRQGLRAQAILDDNGNPKTKEERGYTFPKVRIPGEIDQITEAIIQLSAGTKDAIIRHPNIHFFVDRTPAGVKSNTDSRDQVINGVLNITRTVNSQLPVWSPINKPAYESYLEGNPTNQEILAEQIIFMLYTIRNNLVHGSKNRNDANDVNVVERALPILETVVRSFIR